MSFHLSKYVVEVYRSRSDPRPLPGSVDLLVESARRLSQEGAAVRYVDTIFLPGDETCLHVLEADSEAAVRAVVDRAGIDADRIVPAEQVHPLTLEMRSPSRAAWALPLQSIVRSRRSNT